MSFMHFVLITFWRSRILSSRRFDLETLVVQTCFVITTFRHYDVMKVWSNDILLKRRWLIEWRLFLRLKSRLSKCRFALEASPSRWRRRCRSVKRFQQLYINVWNSFNKINMDTNNNNTITKKNNNKKNETTQQKN